MTGDRIEFTSYWLWGKVIRGRSQLEAVLTLMHLDEGDYLTKSDIAERASMKPGAVGQLLAHLEGRELVETSERPARGGAQVVVKIFRLSKVGRELLTGVFRSKFGFVCEPGGG